MELVSASVSEGVREIDRERLKCMERGESRLLPRCCRLSGPLELRLNFQLSPIFHFFIWKKANVAKFLTVRKWQAAAAGPLAGTRT